MTNVDKDHISCRLVCLWQILLVDSIGQRCGCCVVHQPRGFNHDRTNDNRFYMSRPQNVESRHLGWVKKCATLSISEVGRTANHHIIHLIITKVIIARIKCQIDNICLAIARIAAISKQQGPWCQGHSLRSPWAWWREQPWSVHWSAGRPSHHSSKRTLLFLHLLGSAQKEPWKRTWWSHSSFDSLILTLPFPPSLWGLQPFGPAASWTHRKFSAPASQ